MYTDTDSFKFKEMGKITATSSFRKRYLRIRRFMISNFNNAIHHFARFESYCIGNVDSITTWS